MAIVPAFFSPATYAGEPSIRIVSARPGLVFADNDPVNVQVEITDIRKPVTVEYTIRETSGSWQAGGTVTVPNSTAKPTLPLQLPGRGFYQLHLQARVDKTVLSTDTSIAIVFPAPKPDPASPWGVFFIPPHWYANHNATASDDQVRILRMLGVSWARLNLFAEDFQKVEITASAGRDVAKVDVSGFITNAKALRAQGISVMGNIWQVPRELSSLPADNSKAGDAGPLYCRVKPRDYELWDQMVEDLARNLSEEITVWEIGNEPNLANMYWVGTPEELVEKIRHTSQAIKRGNPQAHVAAAGFVGGFDDMDKLLALGIGRDIDVLSVHYTNEKPDAELWQKLLGKYRLQIPIWTTEEKSAIPLTNLRSGIARSFKFLSVNIGYSEQGPLLRKDLSPLPDAVAYSVGAHCIGTGKYLARNDTVPGFTATFFQRGTEEIAAFKTVSTLPANTNCAVTLAIEPSATVLEVTDVWGRSQPLQVENGKARLSLSPNILFVNGAAKLQVLSAESTAPKALRVFEAEFGRFSSGWKSRDEEEFFGGKVVEIWEQSDPGISGYWGEVAMEVPEEGDYEVFYSGSAPSRLNPPRSISPFVWSIDGGESHAFAAATPRLDPIQGIGEGLYRLGSVPMTVGEHIFRLKLTGRRETPDTRYTLWFDGIALRRK